MRQVGTISLPSPTIHLELGNAEAQNRLPVPRVRFGATCSIAGADAQQKIVVTCAHDLAGFVSRSPQPALRIT